jgi:Pyruvate/2-oxoacid:ferredoxin oxidoreductase delta subunit
MNMARTMVEKSKLRKGVVPVSKPNTKKTKYEWPTKPNIMLKKCTRCWTCVAVCPENAIEIKKNAPSIDYKMCKPCFICLRECPEGAIEERGV